MKGISVVQAEQLRYWTETRDTVHGWKLARPTGRGGLYRRLKIAWMVFTGKYDAVVWGGKQ